MPPQTAPQQPTTADPKNEEPKPQFEKQDKIPYPGLSKEMSPKPDYGEESYKGLGRLEGKAAVITGADSGIGRAVAIAYAREDADVLPSYLPEEEADAKETAQWVRKAGKKAVAFPGDIRQEQYCNELVNRAVQEFGTSTFSST